MCINIYLLLKISLNYAKTQDVYYLGKLCIKILIF